MEQFHKYFFHTGEIHYGFPLYYFGKVIIMTDLEKKLLTMSIVMAYDNKKKLNDISKILEAGDSMLADKHMSMVMKVIEDYIRSLIGHDTVYEVYEESICEQLLVGNYINVISLIEMIEEINKERIKYYE